MFISLRIVNLSLVSWLQISRRFQCVDPIFSPWIHMFGIDLSRPSKIALFSCSAFEDLFTWRGDSCGTRYITSGPKTSNFMVCLPSRTHAHTNAPNLQSHCSVTTLVASCHCHYGHYGLPYISHVASVCGSGVECSRFSRFLKLWPSVTCACRGRKSGRFGHNFVTSH
jgi:hypothetical protein